LQQAADMFRVIDARGHPFNYTLPNGVTGLANTLALEGRCFHRMGDLDRALTFYEMSLINAKFERKKPFKKFLRDLHADMKHCYEHKLNGYSNDARSDLLRQPVQIDPSYCFPFSLEPDRIPLARLYEIDPLRHVHFKDFYEASLKKDKEKRLKDKKSDESMMRTMSISIWAILLAIWSVYIVVFIRALAFK
ncbi:MAG TPA: hypothetical protein VN604_08675, partial [Nitrospirota bacterium]|nr:hypothetical protein [Nitrospirota bacterium]